ncbi:MAG: indole-3-glycerol phosphate synthase TrpC [Alphaproteobacteria bacterium GM202ARS2]|nr:indole-3-glycerol phosphate synthase TrpC [Alphaproteobacteria bacterium GM202ARS2]
MSGILGTIMARKKDDVADGKKHMSLQGWAARIAESSPPRAFRAALCQRAQKGDFAIIAEMKRTSPSTEQHRSYESGQLARDYERAGATCLSVLTEEHFFQGSLDDMAQAKGACGLAVLRKDFIFDVWQVAESRAYGADAILLIMAALSPSQAQELYAAARNWDMDVLVEVHDEADMDKALALAPTLLGINNRNLRTLEVDLQTTERLARHVPQGCVLVSESGIARYGDLCQLRKHGAQAFLVGEHLMRHAAPADELKRLVKPVPS